MLKPLYRIAPLILFAPIAFANTDGIDRSLQIRKYSRPCCGFLTGGLAERMGFSGFVDPAKLGPHDFGALNKKKNKKDKTAPKEKFGMVFTCNGGFVDVAHLRDNADWAAQIYLTLQDQVGTGASVPIRLETDLKSYTLELPKLTSQEVAALTPAILGDAAVTLAFDAGVLHEIGTQFPQTVSGPKIGALTDWAINERNSSFSLEDVYSNLIGAKLGIEAIRSSKPFNEAMTELLDQKLKDLKVVSLAQSREVYQSLKGTWWDSSPYKLDHKNVRKKNFGYTGIITPAVPTNDTIQKICGTQQKMDSEVPGVSMQVGYIRQVPDKRYLRKLKRGIGFTPRTRSKEITAEDFPVIVPAIRARVLKDLPEADTY
ncbi:MAG: DUF4056 domain-containing protein [Bdellovibrionales bacterium]|nr:DUF4056 domain-containing protein [Bdellovibrionales bacterium]